MIGAFRVTAGNVNECTVFAALMDAIAIRGAGGRPHRRPVCVAGDKGYSTPAIRRWCRRHHVRAVIPERSDQIAQRSHRRGRKPAFDPVAYRRRNVVERAVGWLKNLRRVASRAEKLATHFAAVVTIALIGRYVGQCLPDIT